MKKLIKKFIPVFALFVLFTSNSLVNPTITFALPSNQSSLIDTSDINCYSLDVVFLIDQSGSMTYASPRGWQNASDPSGLRLKAVKWAIDWLGDNVLSSCPDAVHRIGVISWGTTAQVDFVEHISPQTITEWQSERIRIKEQVKLSNLEFTKPDIAFNEALKIFNQFDRDVLGELPRKKVIIFLTDGVPYPTITRGWTEQIDSDFPFDPTLLQQENCLAQALTKEDKNNCLGAFKVNNEIAYVNSVYIWSILLNANQGLEYSEYISFLEDVQQISKGHGGRQVSIEHYSQIPPIFLEILSTLAGTKAVAVDCNPFSVDPYLQQATLSIFKINKDIPVEISYKDGNDTYTITQEDVEDNTTWSQPLHLPGFVVKDYASIDDPETTSSIERFVFLRPHAAEWKISAPTVSNCEGIQASFEPLDVDVRLVSPSVTIPQFDLEPYYDESSPIYIEYQLIDLVSQAPIEEEPNYPLDVVATLIGPDGMKEDFHLKYNPGKKTYQSEIPLKVNVVGGYMLESRATTSVKGGVRVLFSGEENYFDIAPTLPFKIKILEPQPGQTFPLHEGLQNGFSLNPVVFRVELTDRSGVQLDPSLILVTPDKSLQGIIYSGSNIQTNFNFSVDPNNSKEFIGQVTLPKEGSYRLSVSITDEKSYIAQYRPDNKIVETDFVLKDTLWTRPITYKVLGITLLALIIVGIIAIALNRNNPVTGTLVFEIGTTHIADIPIGTGWNISKISRRTLQAYSSLGLKSLKVQKSKEQLGCIDYSAVDMNGNPYSGTLMPESTTPFAGGMTIRYDPL